MPHHSRTLSASFRRIALRFYDGCYKFIPAQCPGCGTRLGHQGLCSACAGRLRPSVFVQRCKKCWHPLLVDGGCPGCGLLNPAFDRVVAAFDYVGLGKQLLHEYKGLGNLQLAQLLGRSLEQAILARAWLAGGPPDCIVTVPAHTQSVRRRGFSPPAEIARLLSRRMGLPYSLDLLYRAHSAPRQAMLSRARRMRADSTLYACNLPALRAVRKRYLPVGASGLRIAVVDDVLTTGATMHAVAQSLKYAGATHVEAWVVARALKI